MRADETNHPRGVGGRADTVYISYFRGGGVAAQRGEDRLTVLIRRIFYDEKHALVLLWFRQR